MTSVYFILEGATEGRLESVASQIRYPGDHAVIARDGRGFLWLGDSPERYGPAEDPVTGVSVVVSGRLVWPASLWADAERLPFRGGLAGRLLLSRYLEGGSPAVAPYNGAAMVIISDPRNGTVHLWTDQFGYHPCFLYESESLSQGIITTFPDALLADPAATLTTDSISMAEFLRAWRVTPPHTYYREVKYAGAGSHHCWSRDKGRHTVEIYWNPIGIKFYDSLPEATAELARAVTAAVTERTALAERPLFFMSGGADSRVLLYGGDNPGKVTGLHLYERPNLRESEVSKLLCTRAGAKFVGFQRDPDFYPRMLLENVRWSGAMWSTEDSHYLGVRDVVDEVDPDLVMTACTTDWLFKGYGLEKGYLRVWGRNLPIFRYTDTRVDGFLPNVPSPPPAEYESEIKERIDIWFSGSPKTLYTERDRMIVEDRRIRPACYTVSVSGQMMYRIFPYDTFLADSRIAECYSRIPPKWKLNGDVWGKAAAMICASGGPIVDANFGWPVGSGRVRKLLYFAKGWLARRMDRKWNAQPADESRPPSSGSWPDMGWYVKHSATLRRFWESVPIGDRELMERVAGCNPWARPLQDWSQDPLFLFRMLTLLAHWQIMRERTEEKKRRGEEEIGAE